MLTKLIANTRTKFMAFLLLSLIVSLISASMGLAVDIKTEFAILGVVSNILPKSVLGLIGLCLLQGRWLPILVCSLFSIFLYKQVRWVNLLLMALCAALVRAYGGGSISLDDEPVHYFGAILTEVFITGIPLFAFSAIATALAIIFHKKRSS